MLTKAKTSASDYLPFTYGWSEKTESTEDLRLGYRYRNRETPRFADILDYASEPTQPVSGSPSLAPVLLGAQSTGNRSQFDTPHADHFPEIVELDRDPFNYDLALTLAFHIEDAPADIQERVLFAARILDSIALASLLGALIDRETTLKSREAMELVARSMFSHDPIVAALSGALLSLHAGPLGNEVYEQFLTRLPEHRESILMFVNKGE